MRLVGRGAGLLFALGLGLPVEGGGASSPPLRFVDATEQAGIVFRHVNGASGRRYMVETFGGGVLVLDYDGDGLPDLYFVDGGALPGYDGPAASNRLYRGRGDGTFVDVTEAAGVGGRGYGMGGTAADVDDDGDVDLLVTGFGPELFFRNNGDGTFTEEPGAAGASDAAWSTSATFVDVDEDGFVDLYVANYLRFTVESHKRCVNPAKGIEAYCHPDEYPGVADRLYRNRGGVAFEDASEAAGVVNAREGKGLGVVATDYDDDGDADLYVANDSTRNFLYRNEGDGTFVDVGFEAGVGFNEEGLAEAGMGVDAGDFDRDGRFDLFVTNFDFEKNTLYRNLGGGFFVDATAAAGLGDRSMTELGFGCDFVDLDNDGWLDIALVNGHIQDNIAELQSNLRYAQPAQVFFNEQGRFRDASRELGPALERPRVGRALASLDVDRDGDRDLVLVENGGPAALLRNEGGDRRRSVGLRLVGVAANRDGLGARLRVEDGDRVWVEELRAGSSYLAQNELVLWIGLGEAAALEGATIRWPGGGTETLPRLEAGAVYVVKQGLGVVGRAP